MSFTKALSSISLAALIFTVSGSSSGFAQHTTSPIVAGKEKILAESKGNAKGTDKDDRGDDKGRNDKGRNDQGGDDKGRNDKDGDGKGGKGKGDDDKGEKCKSKTNPKCKPVSPSH